MQTFKITPILFAVAGLYCAFPQTTHAQALTSRINNMCLSADGSVPTIGKPVIMWGCQNVTSQKVELANQKTNYPVAKIAGLCLSSQASTRGSVVGLAQCNNLDQQRFLMGADGFVRQFNLCLAITNGSAAQGAGLILWDCVNHPSQLWNYSGGAAAPPPAPVPTPVPTPAPPPVQQSINQTVSSLNGVPIFLLNGRGAKCLNIYHENRGFNQTISIADCGARGHEQFVFMNNGELRDWGGTSGCVDVRWTDKYVVNRNCGAPTTQSPSWKLNNRGEIRTVVQGRENGWCLDIQQGAQGGISWIAGQGTQAVVASCNGSLTQKWLPGMLLRSSPDLNSFGRMNPGTMGQHVEIGVRGGSLVASGGGNLVASGGGNLVASGGGNLVASGGGNVQPAQISGIRNSSGQLVASGGGNLVASGGGNLVASGGGNVIAAGAGNLVAAGAGN